MKPSQPHSPAANSKVCPSCDLVVDLSFYQNKKRCLCPQCSHVLKENHHSDYRCVASVAFAALVLLIISLSMPFMSIEAAGVVSGISLPSIFLSLRMNWTILLWCFLLFTFVFPLIFLFQLVLIGWFGYRPKRIGAEIYQIAHHFCMVDVFVLSVAVSLVKLTSLAAVHFYTGFYTCILFSILLLWCTSQAHPVRIWELVKPEPPLSLIANTRALDQHVKLCRHCNYPILSGSSDADICPRCAYKVYPRQHHWFQINSALLLSAIIMFLPANLYPIMLTSTLGTETGSNIVEGALLLWNMGSYFVASVIIIASLLIPSFKILTMIILISRVKSRSTIQYPTLSKAYRIVEFIGKWSMIDVFVVILMSAIVQLDGLAVIAPGFAVICFCSVVLMSLLSAEYFDERLIWDRKYHAEISS